MKVYLVLHCIEYEGNNVMEVCSTKRRATSRMKALKKSKNIYSGDDVYWEIDEFIVDENWKG